MNGRILLQYYFCNDIDRLWYYIVCKYMYSKSVIFSLVAGGSGEAGSARRRVLKPAANAMKTLLDNRSISSAKPPSKPQVSSGVGSQVRNSPQDSAPSNSRTVVQRSDPSISMQIPKQVCSAPQATQKSKFVWVNKNMLSKQNMPPQAIERPAKQQESPSTSHYVKKSDYKLVKASAPASSSPGEFKVSNSGTKIVSRYKLIKQDVAMSRAAAAKFKRSAQKSGYTPYISKSGKRLISRYKITQKPSTKPKPRVKRNIDIGASPSLKTRQSKMKTSPYKLDRRDKVILRSRYKIDKLSKSRKPVQKITTTRTTKRSRQSYKWVRSGLKVKSSSFMSPYKLVRTAIINGKILCCHCTYFSQR